MPSKHRWVPSYRLHKSTGQAVVRLAGHDDYLGEHRSQASQEAYRRKVAEWLAAGPPAWDDARPPNVAILLAFWTGHAETHYRRADGSPTGELGNFRESLRPLRRLYGSTTARSFGPLALQAVRQSMVESGLARTTITRGSGGSSTCSSGPSRMNAFRRRYTSD